MHFAAGVRPDKRAAHIDDEKRTSQRLVDGVVGGADDRSTPAPHDRAPDRQGGARSGSHAQKTQSRRAKQADGWRRGAA